MTEAFWLSDFYLSCAHIAAELNSTRPTQPVRSETPQLRGVQDRWTFTEEATAESLGGLPREVKRTTGGGEEDEERREEDEGEVTEERSKTLGGPKQQLLLG